MRKGIMYIQRLGLLVLLMGLMVGCSTSRNAADRTLNEETTALMAMLQDNAYKVHIHTVRPFVTAATQQVVNKLLIPQTGNSAARINVKGNGDHVTIQGDTVRADLPFFGEQRQGGGHYGHMDNGINMNGPAKNYKIEAHHKKEAIVIKFSADDDKWATESYDVIMTVFPNKTLELGMYSSHRTTMNYSGVLEFISATEDEEGS